MEIYIEKMNVEDLKNINLEEFDDFWTIGILEKELSLDTSYYITAKNQSEIVGFAGLNFILDEAHLAYIVTKKTKQNLGIGSKLLECLIEKASKSSSLITLEVNETNSAAIHLYEKYGFQNLGRRKKYYQGKFDAIIMTKYF